MVQELIDLKTFIIEGRYQDALGIIDELEGMGKQAILRNIESFLTRLMIHLIKNQIEQRLTNSWAASIAGSIVEIRKLNLKDNKTSYYINVGEWQPYLEESLELAIRPASQEVLNGQLSRAKLSTQLNREQLLLIAHDLVNLTYCNSVKALEEQLDQYLTQLPGGEAWNTDYC
ncbi:DUF29 family protein [Planktothrix sp. FACHB-1365]|uniref:DUF29 family protein n=1 Tax=Planktothrix sp. FACHB-1365 TaxID=2692855 RepID=UPI0016837312|nr:DUF29 family protein [Planktothrix sp. FACHB-1365]MBD2484104.1 DUF29 family protein [Planktothrix sp. FACHB-1365]